MTTSSIRPSALNNPCLADRVIVFQCERETRDSSTLYELYRTKYSSHHVSVEKISRLNIQDYFYWRVDLDDVSEHSFIVICSGQERTEVYAKHEFIKKYSISSILKSTPYSSSSSSSSYSSSSSSTFDFSSLISNSETVPSTPYSSSSSSSSYSSSSSSVFSQPPKNANKYEDVARRYVVNRLKPVFGSCQAGVAVESLHRQFTEYCTKLKKGRCDISVFTDAVLKYIPNTSLTLDGQTFLFIGTE